MKKYILSIFVVLLFAFSAVYADSEVFDGMKDEGLFVMSDVFWFPFGTSQEEILDYFQPFETADKEEFVTVEFEGDSVDGNKVNVIYSKKGEEDTAVVYTFYKDPVDGLGGLYVYSYLTDSEKFNYDSFKQTAFNKYGFSENDADDFMTSIYQEIYNGTVTLTDTDDDGFPYNLKYLSDVFTLDRERTTSYSNGETSANFVVQNGNTTNLLINFDAQTATYSEQMGY
ncbi:MAG: hypothetical protein IJI14_16135 [Anaerolineaceae bacterium]|nr:hypothetical protein [Anaerolineaceae bacterium]